MSVHMSVCHSEYWLLHCLGPAVPFHALMHKGNTCQERSWVCPSICPYVTQAFSCYTALDQLFLTTLLCIKVILVRSAATLLLGMSVHMSVCHSDYWLLHCLGPAVPYHALMHKGNTCQERSYPITRYVRPYVRMSLRLLVATLPWTSCSLPRSYA